MLAAAFISGCSEESLLPAHSGCWQNAVSCGWRSGAPAGCQEKAAPASRGHHTPRARGPFLRFQSRQPQTRLHLLLTLSTLKSSLHPTGSARSPRRICGLWVSGCAPFTLLCRATWLQVPGSREEDAHTSGDHCSAHHTPSLWPEPRGPPQPPTRRPSGRPASPACSLGPEPTHSTPAAAPALTLTLSRPLLKEDGQDRSDTLRCFLTALGSTPDSFPWPSKTCTPPKAHLTVLPSRRAAPRPLVSLQCARPSRSALTPPAPASPHLYGLVPPQVRQDLSREGSAFRSRGVPLFCEHSPGTAFEALRTARTDVRSPSPTA